jgi:hypothetical protein
MKLMKIFRPLYTMLVPEGVRLVRRRRVLEREMEKERRRIFKNGGSYADAWENGDWQFEFELLEEAEASFHSQKLLGRAHQLRIQTPPLMDGTAVSADYQRSGLDGHRFFLSLSGEQKVRAAIREEEKYRSERWARRIPYLTALSGLIGTVTGLVALLAKWGSG